MKMKCVAVTRDVVGRERVLTLLRSYLTFEDVYLNSSDSE